MRPSAPGIRSLRNAEQPAPQRENLPKAGQAAHFSRPPDAVRRAHLGHAADARAVHEQPHVLLAGIPGRRQPAGAERRLDLVAVLHAGGAADDRAQPAADRRPALAVGELRQLEGEPREDLRPGGSGRARRRSDDGAIGHDAARVEDSGPGRKEGGELRRALVGEARTGVGRAAGDHRRQRRRENPAGRRAQEEEDQARQPERGRARQARRGRKEMPAGNEDARRQGESNADERASHDDELSADRGGSHHDDTTIFTTTAPRALRTARRTFSLPAT